MSGRILLYLDPTTRQWFSDLSMAHNAAEVSALFGTTQIPTPYTAGADWRQMQADLQSLNSGDEVLVDILSRER